MDVSILKGILEIDHKRGVIYFHLTDKSDVIERGLVTVLRICRLPRPIPFAVDDGSFERGMLDITHMVGASWKGESE